MRPSSTDENWRLAAAVAAGGVTFMCTCGAAQLAQLAMFQVHTGSRVLGARLAPSALGALTVGVASAASVSSSDLTMAALSADAAGEPFDLHRRRLTPQSSIIPLLGGLCFLALGGRFWRLAPSSLSHLGALANTARGSLPATLAYASKAEREAIQAFGRRFGCHTCGVRPRPRLLPSPFAKRVIYHADHQPPLSEVKRANAAMWRRVLNAPVRQRFYPQCTTCSSKQSSLLAERSNLIKRLGSERKARQAATVPAAVFHLPSPLRPHYATGAALAFLSHAMPEVVQAAEEARAGALGFGSRVARQMRGAAASSQQSTERAGEG